MQRMLTVDEAAEMLRHSRYTVRNWIKQGRLRATKVGQRYLMSEGAVQELVAPPVEKKLSREESWKLMRELQTESARLGVGPETYARVIRDADERERATRPKTKGR
jgi:excisionase family DNA binding protein